LIVYYNIIDRISSSEAVLPQRPKECKITFLLARSIRYIREWGGRPRISYTVSIENIVRRRKPVIEDLQQEVFEKAGQ
jgi:hypothetical protein